MLDASGKEDFQKTGLLWQIPGQRKCLVLSTEPQSGSGMKQFFGRYSLVLLLFFVGRAGGYSQVNDNFSDGDFTASPTWTGDQASFEVDLNNELHLNAPAVTDQAYLSTPSASINDASWEFLLRMDFNPSASNFADIYLVSDSANLEGTLNGYFVRVGGTSDEVSLYRQDGNNSTEILDGLDDRVDDNPVNIRIRVTRDAAGNWEVLSDTLGGTVFASEGTIQDTTHQQSLHVGWACTYTSTRSDKFYLDDVVVTGTGFQDTQAPTVVSATAISDQNLDVLFNEAVDPTTANDASNYSVNGGLGNAGTAAVDGSNPALVHLAFAGNFVNGSSYQLTVNGVEDLVGNAISNVVQPFIYFVSQPAVVGDIVINEIFPDPNPTVGLPEEEFVEIYNASNKVFDLAGWTYADASSTVSLPSFFISPGDHLILCADEDSALYAPYGDVLLLSSWPTLNNDGDDLSLTDTTGLVVDAVSYKDSWYKDAQKADGGFTLERINPTTPCGGSSNWTASNALDGGTPGSQNAVFSTAPDLTPPTVVSVSVVGSNQLEVQFNERMDSTSLALASYTLSQGMNVVSVAAQGPDFLAVLLDLSANVVAGQLDQLSISGATDCVGNALPTNSTTFGIGAAPQPFDLVINELAPDPDPEISNLPDAEFVELYNASNRLIDLDGLTLSDRSGSSNLPEGQLLPGEHLILCPSTAVFEFTTYGRVLGLSGFPSLNNTGDRIALRDGSGTTIDVVEYTDDWYQDEEKSAGGWTLERIVPEDFCALSTNWQASESANGGTPGTVNSVFDPNLLAEPPSWVSAVLLGTDSMALFFSRSMDSLSLTAATYSISPTLQIEAVYPVGPAFEAVHLKTNGPLQAGTSYIVSISGPTDCKGTTLSGTLSRTIILPEPGDVAINEVLFNPIGFGTDFVELVNTTAVDLNLRDWSFGYLDSDDSLRQEIISTENYVLAPGAFVLISENSQNVLFNYPLSREEVFLETNLPSYANTAGSVILLDNLGNQVDRFNYSEDLHFPLLSGVDGVSLERIDVERPSSDPTNWHSAAEEVGFATPGYENSQYSPGEGTPEEVSVSPEVFSPDNDGFDDVLNISYNLDGSGYVGTIIIYDSKGREERTLVQNVLLSPEGVFSWDGTLDSGERARTGIHIVYMEVFTPDGTVKHFKNTCVVASRY